MASPDAPDHAPSRPWMRELIAGAVQPSLAALSGALLVAAALLIASVSLLTPELLAKADRGYFMVDRKDDYAYLTSTVLQVSQTDPSQKVIALIGASALRESIADAGYLSGLMEEELGEQFCVLQLTAAGLTHWEAAAIAERIAVHVQGMVVLEVSPGKMALPIGFFEDLVRQPRLALDSEVFDEETRLAGFELPRRTGNFFLDHHGFFSARPSAVLNLVRGPVVPDLHQAKTWRIISEEEWAHAEVGLHRRIGGYPENGQRNFEVMGRTIARLRESGGIRVVLLESVRNPRADRIMRESPECREALEMYERDVQAHAEAWNVPYLDITAEAGLVPGEFVDTSHIWDGDAAKRYTRALASHLVLLMNGPQTNREG